jgi:acid stress-induced BolA-like protein IbaG/YrbA
MDPAAVKTLIEQGMPGARVQVNGDGRHFEAVVISEAFAGKSLLQKHRLVMATVHEHIRSDELHALSIKAYTPGEWEARAGG